MVLVRMDPGIQWVISLNLRPMYPMRIFVESRFGILLIGVEGPWRVWPYYLFTGLPK